MRDLFTLSYTCKGFTPLTRGTMLENLFVTRFPCGTVAFNGSSLEKEATDEEIVAAVEKRLEGLSVGKLGLINLSPALTEAIARKFHHRVHTMRLQSTTVTPTMPLARYSKVTLRNCRYSCKATDTWDGAECLAFARNVVVKGERISIWPQAFSGVENMEFFDCDFYPILDGVESLQMSVRTAKFVQCRVANATIQASGACTFVDCTMRVGCIADAPPSTSGDAPPPVSMQDSIFRYDACEEVLAWISKYRGTHSVHPRGSGEIRVEVGDDGVLGIVL